MDRENPRAAADIGGTKPDDLAKVSSKCPGLTSEDFEHIESMDYWCTGVISSTLCIVGVLMNTILAVAILKMSRIRVHTFNLLLICLIMSDNLYLIGRFIDSFRKPFNLLTGIHVAIFPHFLYPGQFFSLACSIFMEVAITLERYISVYTPLRYAFALFERIDNLLIQ